MDGDETIIQPTVIHAYMYATESKVLGLDQIGVFQTTESSLYTPFGTPLEPENICIYRSSTGILY